MEITRQYFVKQRSAASIDRLSALPDDVLVNILSFLRIKLSASTSILAKRWRFLWAHVPILDLSDDDGDHYSGSSFSSFVNKVILLHKRQTIDTFNLFHTGDCSEFELKTWIANVIDRSVQNLDICLNCQVLLPQCLFTCKTLVDLTLWSCGNITTSCPVYLPSLKRLDLHSFQFECDETLPHLISGCPVLEQLIIVRDNSRLMTVCCCIISSTLTRLVLDSYFEKENKNAFFEVKLDTPALRYLKLHDFVPEKISAGALTSLTEADISFHCEETTEGDVLYSRSVIKFVGQLCNVEHLKLSVDWMAVPDCVFDALTIKFHNLTKLELAADYRSILIFLENAENLEVLTIHMLDDNLKYWTEPQHVPMCLSSHLRTVTIREFCCADDEFDIIRYLLRNAKILKRMEIFTQSYGTDLNNELGALKRISLFERGSEACQVAFH